MDKFNFDTIVKWKKIVFNLKHGRDNINRTRDRGELELCRVERFKISKRVE